MGGHSKGICHCHWHLCRKATSLAVYRCGGYVVGAHGAGTTFSNNDAVAIRDIVADLLLSDLMDWRHFRRLSSMPVRRVVRTLYLSRWGGSRFGNEYCLLVCRVGYIYMVGMDGTA